MSLRTTGVLTAEQWLNRPPDPCEGIVFGSPGHALIESGTKNIIEGPEKSFKTSFLVRLMLAASCGVTVYDQLPLFKTEPRRVLYVHGELSPGQIKQRTTSAARNLPRPLEKFLQVRDLDVHAIEPSGQKKLAGCIEEHHPTDLVLDPWQSFISGFDENDFKDISKATRFLDGLISEFDVTVYIATHTGKDRKRGTRGHSSLSGWRDCLIRVKRSGVLLNVEVEPRWDAPLDPFALRFRDGTIVPTDEMVYSPNTLRIIGSLREQSQPVPRVELARQLGLSEEALRKALSRARSEKAPIACVDGTVELEVEPMDIEPVTCRDAL